MKVELQHVPAASALPFVLSCTCGVNRIQVGFRSREEAEAALPEFARAVREAFQS